MRASIYIWLTNGSIDFFDMTETPKWFSSLGAILYTWLIIDTCLGAIFQWYAKHMQRGKERKCPLVNEIIWNGHVSAETKNHAQIIFQHPQKIIWYADQQTLYYLSGCDLLMLGAKGEFINLTQDGNSDFIRRLIRTEVCLFLSYPEI